MAGLMKAHDFTPTPHLPNQCGQCGYGKHNSAHTGRKVHSLDIPTEPPLYSVVVDNRSRAWQRVPPYNPNGAARWHVVPAHPTILETGSCLGWASLLAKHGPLTEIFRIDQAQGAA